MKKAYWITAGMFFTVTMAIAQAPNMKAMSPEEAAQFKTDRMLEKGVIEEDQKDAAYQIHLKQATELDEYRNARKGQFEQAKAEREAIRAKTETEWDGLLTAELQAKRENLRKAQKDRMQEKRARMKDQRFHKMDHCKDKGKQQQERMNK